MVNKVAQSQPSRPPQAWRHQGSASERTSTALQGPRAALGALFTAAQEEGTRGRGGWGSWLDLEPGGCGVGEGLLVQGHVAHLPGDLEMDFCV